MTAETFIRGSAGGGMGGHSQPVRGESCEWYTPPHIFEALGLSFGMDPCAPPGGLPWIPAERAYSIEDDGLSLPWLGTVWLNPPYGEETARWMRRLVAHGDGVALVFARTETRWFHETVPSADAVCFIAGRLTFVDAAGAPSKYNAGAPSMLVAYGRKAARAVAHSGLGMVFKVRGRPLLGQASLWEAPAS